MPAQPGPVVASTITLKFDSSEALADALRTYSGQFGMGGLCLQVVKYYELGDLVQLTLEAGDQPMRIQAVVAWRKPGFIGARFQPATADENRTFVFLRRLMGEAGHGTPPPVAEQTKPFAE